MPKSWRTIEITQQCKFGWNEQTIKSFLEGWSPVKDYAFICHDKDINADGSFKEPHYHLMCRFNSPVPTSAILARFASACPSVQIAEQNFERCKKWTSAVAYLTHENVSGKYVYDRALVSSNYDFGVDIDAALSDKVLLSNAVDGIVSGVIREYNVPDHISPQIYVNYKTKIDAAFSYRTKMLLQRGDRDMRCIFIKGDSGVGKTTYAKQICRDKNLSFFVSSGSNDVLDGYGGQDVIILDDLRPSALSLSDLLKMLDNNTASTVKSRYRNKVLECQLIIITTTKDIETFFGEVFENEDETKIQLMRRCELLIHMSLDEITYYTYNKRKRKYEALSRIPNMILKEYKLDDMSREERVSLVTDLLGGTAELAENMRKGILSGDFLDVDEMSASSLPDGWRK